MKLMRYLAVIFFALIPSGTALAEGFAVYEWSARGVALGGATMSRSADPSVVSANPAAMVNLPGAQVQAGISVVMPVGRIRFNDGPPNNKFGRFKVADEYWPMPSAYFTYQLNDRVSLGVGEYTRFGLGLDYPVHWHGRYNIQNIELQTASLTPVAAFRLTDKLSLGLGFEAMYLDVLIKKASPGTGDPATGTPATDIRAKIEGDNVGFGGNLSLHYKLNDEWAFGAIYRSAVEQKVDGDVWMTLPAGAGGTVVKSGAHATLTLPESVAFSAAYSPRPDLSLEIMATWTRWSRFRYLNIHFDDNPLSDGAMSTKHWKDAWRLGFGVEYSPLDWLDLRAGYVWDGCPVTEGHEDYLIPTDNRQIWSLGTGMRWRDWTFDFAYAFLYAHKRSYATRASEGVFASQTYDTRSHIVSLSAGYKF